MRLAALVLRADADVDRAVDVDEHAGQAQAALLHRLALVARPLEHGVDERGDRRLGLDAVDEHAVHDADLGRGEADPERVVHELPHAADLLAQRVVEAVDRQRAAAQDRVAVLADELERRVAPRTRLRVEPRGRILLGDLGGLVSSIGHAEAILALAGRAQPAGHCGSTSTVNATSRCSRRLAAPVDRRAHRGDRRRAVVRLDDDLRAVAAAQAEQRRRAEHGRAAGVRGRGLGDLARRGARRRRAPRRSRRSRIRSANGG